MFETSEPSGPPESSHSPVSDASEWYERGLALRKAGLFRPAVEQFKKAAVDSSYLLKAYAQMGLCYKSLRQYEEAVMAFRAALNAPNASPKETVQLLYVLGRTLESLDRTAEALEVYRWLRREDNQFRDVADRIQSLGAGRAMAHRNQAQRGSVWTRPASEVFQDLLWNTK